MNAYELTLLVEQLTAMGRTSARLLNTEPWANAAAMFSMAVHGGFHYLPGRT